MLIGVNQRGKNGRYLTDDTECMSVTAVFTMLHVEIRCCGCVHTRYCLSGVKLATVIAVRVTGTFDVSSAVQAHEEHGNHDKFAPEGFHSAAMVHRFLCPVVYLFHIYEMNPGFFNRLPVRQTRADYRTVSP
ncbi:MAG: hypothetical protein GXP15_05715 [Gammaproteobacteria bacterium]|nr:hypothetical protein [Gammaproteobacteria bacterium]